MKILYAVQGTGNGHITRAIEIIPYLEKRGKLDVLVSGIQSDIALPFEVKYRLNGLSFIFGKKGGVDMWRTFVKMNTKKLLKDIKQLPVENYDLIISDFEPVSCWAGVLAQKPVIGLSNQVATLHPLAPKPKKTDPLGKMVLKHYAPTSFNYGFHFKKLDNTIFTPIIRKEVREALVGDLGHYTVYLPSYSDERILKILKRFKKTQWQVFSKHSHQSYSYKNIHIQPVHKDLFLQSMASASGVICNAGFGAASEALFLRKKLLVIPMKGQYEQACNAAMLKSMGVPVLKKLKKKYRGILSEFIETDEIVKVDYPDQTRQIIDMIIKNHAGKTDIGEGYKKGRYSFFQ